MSVTDDLMDLVDFVPATKLSRDLRKSAGLLTEDQARYLVDLYYSLQEHRIATANQSRSLSTAGEPVELIDWFCGQLRGLESAMPSVMKVWAERSMPGRWLMAQHGIGPVIAAGLLAHLDHAKGNSPSSYWRFAGLDPTSKWEKGQRRPWNANLKVLCWKAGDSFVKQSGNEKCFYGHLYRERKQYELGRDEAGGNAETARQTLEVRKFNDKKTKDIYESGHLPPGRLDLRARRYAVKMLLAHFWEVQWRDRHPGQEPPVPYSVSVLGHKDIIPPPNFPID